MSQSYRNCSIIKFKMKGCIAIIVLCASVIVQSENVCPEDYTQELLLRHEDCDKFYKCAFGEPVEQDCPAGLHFNLDLEQCDWKENVDCTDRNDPTNPKPEESVPESEEEPEPESEKEPTPDPEEEPTPESEEEPESESEEEPTPDPEEEPTPESEEELESESEEEPTPDPEEEPLPEPEEEPLPEPEEEPAPEPEEEPVLEPEEGSAEEESSEPEIDVEEDGSGQEIDELVSKEIDDIEVLENGCPVDPHVHWLLPHEDYCNLFYYCVWGEKVLRECPASLHFNSVLQVCDWPNDAGCLSSFNKHVEARRALLEDF